MFNPNIRINYFDLGLWKGRELLYMKNFLSKHTTNYKIYGLIMKYIIILILKIMLNIYCFNLLKLLHPKISLFSTIEQYSPY